RQWRRLPNLREVVSTEPGCRAHEGAKRDERCHRVPVAETRIWADANSAGGHVTMRVAFVLSGGASLGASQAGMLQALYEDGIRPDLLIGTSAGAINAAFIASRPPT